MTLPRSLTIWTLGCLVVIPFLYWNYTGHVWEDFLITYRHSENFVAGQGLTHQPGTLVHGFTSPLNVLVPTLFAWLTKTEGYALPLLLTNFVTLGCLAFGGLFLQRALFPLTPEKRRWALWLLPLFLALNIKVTAFTVNGQEAGYWVLFLAISFHAMVGGISKHWLGAGIGWAGLMWTRPDSPVHIVLLAAAALVCPATLRRDEFKGILKAAGICTLLYLPWFIGAWIYYGSPIPHTILAKSGAYGTVTFGDFATLKLISRVLGWVGEPFLPIYSFTGGWPSAFLLSAAVVGVVGVFSIASSDRIVRLAALGFAGSCGYLGFVDLRVLPFPWYFVPPAVFGAILATRWLSLASGARLNRSHALAGFSVVLLCILAYGFSGSLKQIEAQQRIIENGVRREVGLWLRQNVKAEERVYLEPIGYIGYFSRARLLDFPGLVSPEVVATRKRHEVAFFGVIDYLRPEWLVLRPTEYDHFKRLRKAFADYEVEVIFDARDALKPLAAMPGIGYLHSDVMFYVMKRKAQLLPDTK